MDKATLTALTAGDMDLALLDPDQADQYDTVIINPNGQEGDVTLHAARYGRVNVWTDKDRLADPQDTTRGLLVHSHATVAEATDCHNMWVDHGRRMAAVLAAAEADTGLAMAFALIGQAEGGLNVERAEQIMAEIRERFPHGTGIPPSSAPVPATLAVQGDPLIGQYL